jgi:hypothetical protein
MAFLWFFVCDPFHVDGVSNVHVLSIPMGPDFDVTV